MPTDHTAPAEEDSMSDGWNEAMRNDAASEVAESVSPASFAAISGSADWVASPR